MRDIKNFEGKYAITEDGRVWSYRSKKYLKPLVDKDGYLFVHLWDKGSHTYKIHRLVADAYIPNPTNLPQVNHKDEDKTNNSVSNLEWCNHTYNMRYGTRAERQSATLRSKATGRAVYCVELNKVFHSIKEGALSINVNRSCIWSCVNGYQHSAGGYHWRYV